MIGRLSLNTVAAGPASSGGPHVRVFDAVGGTEVSSLFAYEPTFGGGVHVALRDMNADSVPDLITGPGPGAPPQVRVFDGVTRALLWSFLAYDPAFLGGVSVAVGDVDGDGKADVITGAGPGGGPHVRVFRLDAGGVSEVLGFFAYDPAFRGGVHVATGDVDGDGRAEIITGAGPGGGPHVRIWKLTGDTVSELTGFFAYVPGFTGGVSVAAGDIGGSGRARVITGAGPGGGPHVQVFEGTTAAVLLSLFAFAPAFTGGVSVAAGDVDCDGKADILAGAGPGGGPHVKALDGATGTLLSGPGRNFFAYDPAFPGGIVVAAAGCLR